MASSRFLAKRKHGVSKGELVEIYKQTCAEEENEMCGAQCADELRRNIWRLAVITAFVYNTGGNTASSGVSRKLDRSASACQNGLF